MAEQLTVFSLKVTPSGQKDLIPSIFKQALNNFESFNLKNAHGKLFENGWRFHFFKRTLDR